MALSKNIKTKAIYYISDNFDLFQAQGLPYHIEKEVDFQGCYIQITNVSGNKEKVDINVTTFLHATKQNIINTTSYSFVPTVGVDADDFIKQGYEYLKTLPEYADAIDILEEGQTL